MYSEIKQAARSAMLKLIEAEREGEQIDRSLLKNVLGIYQEVSVVGSIMPLSSGCVNLCRPCRSHQWGARGQDGAGVRVTGFWSNMPLL